MLLAEVALLLLATQGALSLLARALGRRVDPLVFARATVLPLVVLWPWLTGNRLLFPGELRARRVPGSPFGSGTDAHQLLNDPVFQFLPWELDVRHALKAGPLPLWSDAIDGGSSP